MEKLSLPMEDGADSVSVAPENWQPLSPSEVRKRLIEFVEKQGERSYTPKNRQPITTWSDKLPKNVFPSLESSGLPPAVLNHVNGAHLDLDQAINVRLSYGEGHCRVEIDDLKINCDDPDNFFLETTGAEDLALAVSMHSENNGLKSGDLALVASVLLEQINKPQS